MVANRNNYALEFNGSSSYVALSDSYNNNNLTVESYIKIRNLASENYTGIVTNVETSGYGLIVDNTAKKLGARIYVNNSYYYAYADQLVETNRWYHLAMTYDGKVLKLYVDGILQSSPTNIVGTIKSSSVKMAIGCNPGTINAEFFNGWIDEVRIWSRALDASEIAENMNKILTGTENGLVGYFRFEEGSGNIAYDLSSRKLNGTINLATWVNGEIDLYLKPNKTLLKSNNKVYSFVGKFSENLVPIMTSANTPSGEVTSSGYYGAYLPYYVFDRNEEEAKSWFVSSNVGRPAEGHWVKYKFITPQKVSKIAVKAMLIRAGQYSVKQFVFQGSNDDINFDNLIMSSHPNSNEKVEYKFNNDKEYLYYKFVVIESHGNTYEAGLNELEMFGIASKDVIELPDLTEEYFLNYGMSGSENIDFSNTFITKRIIVNQQSELGSGKIFEHEIDLSERRVDKIILN